MESQLRISFFVLKNNHNIYKKNIGRFFHENRYLIDNIVVDDNSNSRYKSIREWLNEKIKYIYSNRKKYEDCYIFFAHQDVYIYKSFFKYFKHFVTQINVDEIGLIGFAGKDSSNISHSFLLDSGVFCFTGESTPIEIETADEFCFAIPSTILTKHILLLSDISGWHAYAAELSIILKSKYLKTYYFPIFMEHNSTRTNNIGLFLTHKKIYSEYGTSIHTLVGEIKEYNWRDSIIRTIREFYYSRIKFKIKGTFILRMIYYYLDRFYHNRHGFRELDYLLSINDCDFYFLNSSSSKIDDFTINKVPVNIYFRNREKTKYQSVINNLDYNKNVFLMGCGTRLDGFKYINKLDINYKILKNV